MGSSLPPFLCFCLGPGKRRRGRQEVAEAGEGWLETETERLSGGRCVDRASVYVNGGVRVRPSGGSEKPSDKILRLKMVVECEEARVCVYSC